MEQQQQMPQSARFVGKASNAGDINPPDPQWWLAGSLHPYAPFVGNALKWESYAYDDGTTYEGLMLNSVPHNKGVLVFGNGLGGGIQKAKRADRYEGEFDTGFAHGLGQYTSTDGKVYRGEYSAGLRHGCGVEYNMSPFLKRVEQGMDADAAWKEAQPEIESKARYGTWVKDAYLTGPDDTGRWCHIYEIKGTEQEVSSVVAKARMFEFKPDGEVTIRMQQDANGLPAPLMQDPLHYPHGTKFLAPGPMGQCFPVPDNDALKLKMAQAAETHRKIYEQYNLPYNIEPGSVMDKAQKLWKRKHARRQRAIERKLQRDQNRLRQRERVEDEDEEQAAAKPAPASKKQQSKAVQEEEEEPLDDDDLVASTSDEQQQQAAAGRPLGAAAPHAFASMSLSVSRAAAALQRAFHQAALRAPPRRQLTRPS